HGAAIHDAAIAGDLARVTTLLDGDPALARLADSFGNSPLHYAALIGHTAIAQKLLASAPDVNVRNLQDQTPLHEAAMNGQVSAAEILLDNGADIEARAFGGIRPLHLAARMGQDAMVQLLVARGGAVQARTDHQETALYLAAAGRPTLG